MGGVEMRVGQAKPAGARILLAKRPINEQVCGIGVWGFDKRTRGKEGNPHMHVMSVCVFVGCCQPLALPLSKGRGAPNASSLFFNSLLQYIHTPTRPPSRPRWGASARPGAHPCACGTTSCPLVLSMPSHPLSLPPRYPLHKKHSNGSRTHEDASHLHHALGSHRGPEAGTSVQRGGRWRR